MKDTQRDRQTDGQMDNNRQVTHLDSLHRKKEKTVRKKVEEEEVKESRGEKINDKHIEVDDNMYVDNNK